MKDRQYGPLEAIRRDHTERYRFAASKIPKGSKVLDLACGCGYGSWILHEAGMKVTGADIEPEAISYAEKNYPGPAYIRKAAEEIEGQYDAIVTFETLEHIYYPGSILKAIQAPLVIASVPNEERYKFLPKAFEGDKYPHLRHYTPTEFEQLLNGSGLMVVERFCQKDKHGDVEPGTDGVFLISVCTRI